MLSFLQSIPWKYSGDKEKSKKTEAKKDKCFVKNQIVDVHVSGYFSSFACFFTFLCIRSSEKILLSIVSFQNWNFLLFEKNDIQLLFNFALNCA